MEKIKALASVMIGTFFSTFGLLAVPLLLLLACQTSDHITGIMAAKYNGESVKSKIFSRGIWKKASMYFLVFVGYAVDILIKFGSENLGFELPMIGIVACVITVWLIANELLSIAENCERMELNVPFLKPLLNLVKTKVEESTSIK